MTVTYWWLSPFIHLLFIPFILYCRRVGMARDTEIGIMSPDSLIVAGPQGRELLHQDCISSLTLRRLFPTIAVY